MEAKPTTIQEDNLLFAGSQKARYKKVEADLCTVQSEYADRYKESMRFYVSLVQQQDDKIILEKLKKCGVLYEKAEQAKRTIQLSVKNTSINREVIILMAKFGQFEMEIKILNIQGENSRHKNSKSKGEHGNIYQGYFLSKQFAMKCIPIKSKSTRRNAIAEWFIAKIASIFQFGPSIDNVLGFDILMYQTCIEFPMENCRAVDYSCINVNMLYWNLALMHSLNLVHCDIKPENIMLSHSFKKIVFIDFGLSTFVSQGIGLKSFSLFVGGIQFCSSQMSKCILSTLAVPIDLYYNDLCCILGTLKLIQNTIQVSFCEWQQYLPQPYIAKAWLYLLIYKLKFHLFEQKIDFFLTLWNNANSQNNLKSYKEDILLFLQELYPTKQLKDFFWKFITDSEIDSEHCSRIKVIYEITQENLCSIQMLTNREKLVYFTAYLEEYIKEQEIHENVQNNRKKAISDLMINPSAIRNQQYLSYADIYLQYMSYMDNKFSVNAAKREEAAKVYYSVYISPKISQISTGRQIIEQTIRHIMQTVLKNKQLGQNENYFAIFSFRLYIFIIVLDIGSPSQVLDWLDVILTNFCSENYKFLFLQWVTASNELQENRNIKKGALSRVQFIQIIYNWVFKNKKIIKQKALFKCPQNNVTFTQQNSSFSQQFLQQFGYFIFFESEFILSPKNQYLNMSNNRDIQYLNEMIRSKTPRWTFLMLKLLQRYYNKRNNSTLCKKIYSVFKNSISDQQLLMEFSFQFRIRVYFQIFTTQNFTINHQFLEKTMDYLSQIDPLDLVLFYKIVKNFYNKLMVKNTFGTRVFQVLERNKALFCKFIGSQVYHYQKLFSEDSMYHACISPIDLQDLISMSKQLQFKITEIKELFQQIKRKKVACQICRGIIEASLSLQKINGLLTSFIKEKKYLDQINSEAYLNQLFRQQTKTIDLVQSLPFLKQYWQQIALSALRSCQLVCCLKDQIQDKYHGIQNFYQTAQKYNKISWFLQSEYQNSFPIIKTLIVLQRKGEGKHILFMFKLTEYLGKSLLYKDYLIIVVYCRNFFSLHSQQQLQTLFRELKKQSAFHPTNHYLAIIFQILLSQTLNVKLQRAVISIVRNLFPKLHYRFQRALAMLQYFIVLQSLNNQRNDKRLNKKWLFCNNRLVKQLNIFGSSFPHKQRKKMLKSKKDFLVMKIRNIEKVSGGMEFKIK